MPKKDTYPGGPDDLRKRAEDIVSNKYSAEPGHLEALIEANRVVHELRVHQIELEMQNEELERAHLALEESRDKYADLYDFAPVGYFSFTREAIINEVNLTGATLLGIDRGKLINARFRRFVAPEDFEKWDRYLSNVFVIGEKQSCDLRLIREDNSLFDARIESIRIAEKSRVHVARTALSDISIQKNTEMKLQRYSIELEKNNAALQDALDKIKQLSGLLPICASCKNIRDDKGSWNQIESYISNHSEALFSHGLCPDCAEKAKQEFADYVKKNPSKKGS